MKDMMQQSYHWITNIYSQNFENKSVMIIGGGEMAKQYSLALSRLNVKDVTIITRTKKDPNDFSDKFKYQIFDGGFEKHLPLLDKNDLTIIATPTELLMTATKLALDSGHTNILIEKPGSLYHKEMSLLAKNLNAQKVRIAYNRLLYPSFHKLKLLAKIDGGITSCKFDFTEWVHRIPFGRYKSDEYRFWGISNSLHVISMAIELIGKPKQISTYQYGKFDWHPSGSVFVGSGISEENIPFSYHADWGSSGRWGIEVMTEKNAYRLIPLEELYVCPKGTVNWEQVTLDTAFPDVKPGIAEEIAMMLDDGVEEKIKMPSLQKATEYNKLAEKIFGYNLI